MTTSQKQIILYSFSMIWHLAIVIISLGLLVSGTILGWFFVSWWTESDVWATVIIAGMLVVGVAGAASQIAEERGIIKKL